MTEAHTETADSTHILWRPPASHPFAVYKWTLTKPPSDRDPDLLADFETLSEAIAWSQTVPRHPQRNLTLVEIFDWNQGVSWDFFRVG